MNCVICHSDEVVLTKTKEEIRQGNNIVVVPINVLLCSSCGEKYYDRKTMLYLEQVKRRIKHSKTPLKQIGRVMAYS